MIISIFASIGAYNLGDELILKNEIKLLEEEHGKDTQFEVFSYDCKNPFFKKSNITYKEYFPLGIKKPSNFFKNIYNFFSFFNSIRKSDLIVIGGGGIIYDSEIQSTNDPLDTWVYRTNIFKFFNKKINFFAVGINIKEKFNLHKLKKIFSGANSITVRDEYSYNLLTELGLSSTIVLDPVFSDVKDLNKTSYMLKEVDSLDFSYKDLADLDLEGKKVALALRKGYLWNNEDKLKDKFEEGKINELINFILGKGGEVILLPHSFHKTDELANDYLFLKQFLRINEKIRIIGSMEEVYVKYIYKEFDMCFAMRLHSIILSQIYEIPYVGISYSRKTKEALDMINNLNK